MTIISGGQVLFGGSSYAEAAGNYVPFVVCFNFAAGFFYLWAGIGLWFYRPLAVWLSLLIAVTTFVVFILFGIHILQGGFYEMRTVIAMMTRLIIWIIIFAASFWILIRKKVNDPSIAGT
jgi:heme/copper-type cytochrome/quinol oxidase subunit 4